MHTLELVARFQVSGNVGEAQAFGNGHINDTYKILNGETGRPEYVLQRINTQIFTNVPRLMQNMAGVLRFIEQKPEFQGLSPALIPTKLGNYFVENTEGFWRMFHFVEGLSLDRPATSKQAYHGAFGYGKFLKALDGYPLNSLHTTLPNFHNINYRLHQFDEALKQFPPDRRGQAEIAVKSVQQKRGEMSRVFELASSGSIPLRVTHNDTKFNNVRLGLDGKSSTVIDLDTVMPGFSFFDVGDGLRSAAISADEDEPDLRKVKLNPTLYDSFLEGYLDAASDILTTNEKKLLPKSGEYMAFIMGVRFLTDFLNGDVYYKTNYPNHNLVRANNQLFVSDLFGGKSKSTSN